MRYKLIMLDGFCSGQIYDWHEAPPEFTIYKPKQLSMHSFDDCDICRGLIPDKPDEVRYKRTFIGEDKEVILYTLSGESNSILNSRDWVKTPWQHAVSNGKPPIIFVNAKQDLKGRN